MVDGGRLWRRISELGEIGRQEAGGVTRLSFTDEEHVTGWAHESHHLCRGHDG